MVGESQLKKFMQSVETVSDNLEKTDSALDRQKQEEADLDEKAAVIKEMIEEKGEAATVATAGKRDGKAASPLSEILSAGAQFLSNLSKIISGPGSSGGRPLEKQLSSFIKSDEKTGRTYLNIPLPEAEVLSDLFSVLGEVISKTIVQPQMRIPLTSPSPLLHAEISFKFESLTKLTSWDWTAD